MPTMETRANSYCVSNCEPTFPYIFHRELNLIFFCGRKCEKCLTNFTKITNPHIRIISSFKCMYNFTPKPNRQRRMTMWYVCAASPATYTCQFFFYEFMWMIFPRRGIRINLLNFIWSSSPSRTPQIRARTHGSRTHTHWTYYRNAIVAAWPYSAVCVFFFLIFY